LSRKAAKSSRALSSSSVRSCIAWAALSKPQIPLRRDAGGGAAGKDGINGRTWMSGRRRTATEDGIIEMRRNDERTNKSIGHGVSDKERRRLETQTADLGPSSARVRI
jgi:hypothetical protein